MLEKKTSNFISKRPDTLVSPYLDEVIVQDQWWELWLEVRLKKIRVTEKIIVCEQNIV